MDNRTKDTTSSLTDVISEPLNPSKVVPKSNEIIIAEQSKKIESLTHDSTFANEANKQFRDLVFHLGDDFEKLEKHLTTPLFVNTVPE